MWFHLRLLEQCNLRCAHCYARGRDRAAAMDLPMVKSICGQIGEIDRDGADRTVVYLSGGEPFLHPRFWEILDFVNSCGHIDGINILSNGIAVPRIADRLLPYREKTCVQVSVDGDEAAHDAIRGAGTFAKASRALRLLDDLGISHWIGFTVSVANVHSFGAVLDLAKATNSLHNNVTPYTGDPALMLGYPEWKEFKYRFERYAAAIGLRPSRGPNSCGFMYACGAFSSGLTVNPDGTVTGCARDNRACGSHERLDEAVSREPLSMHATCMREKWGKMEHFAFVTRLE